MASVGVAFTQCVIYRMFVDCSSIKTLPSFECCAAAEMAPSAGCLMLWVRFFIILIQALSLRVTSFFVLAAVWLCLTCIQHKFWSSVTKTRYGLRLIRLIIIRRLNDLYLVKKAKCK